MMIVLFIERRAKKQKKKMPIVYQYSKYLFRVFMQNRFHCFLQPSIHSFIYSFMGKKWINWNLCTIFRFLFLFFFLEIYNDWLDRAYALKKTRHREGERSSKDQQSGCLDKYYLHLWLVDLRQLITGSNVLI